ncbi:MAG: methyltransferase [Pseudomonadota bacterium]
MSDDTLSHLLNHASNDEEPVLLVIDENDSALPAPRHAESRAISNRYDVCHSARRQQWLCSFSDFWFSAELMQDCRKALYRVSKEKRVVEHVLQSLWQLLPVNGELHVAGYKNEGIKTFAKRMATAWDCSIALERGEGNLHLFCFTKRSEQAEPLQAADYHALQPIGEWQGRTLHSKPGVFAWDRFDAGSVFLLDYLPKLLSADHSKQRALDLGCGSGLLAVALAQAGYGEIVATDNNAAAIRACEFNLQQLADGQQAYVIPDDIGTSIRGTFDLILCNPPFHQGFAVEQDLTDRFLEATCRLLKNSGKALFVVNSFIPLERKAKDWFGNVEKVADDRQYKLVILSHQGST